MRDESSGLRAEVVAVGTELLLGENVDTNSAWISSRFAEIGVDVFRHVTVGDNVVRLLAALRDAASRADAVVVTGGLGATQDDLTRFAVARLAGVDLERRADLVEHVEAHFARTGRPMPPRNRIQADLPAGARVLAPVGTAAGFAVEVDGTVIYCLPGVPTEMATMVDRDVVPDLAGRAGLATTVSRLVRTAGVSESGVAERCAGVVERLDAVGNPTVAFLASRGETRVRVTAKAGSREAALALVDPVVDEVVGLLGAAVVGLDGEGVEHAVGRQLRRLGWTLAVGESVTGGGVGARLVTVAGASDWFRGGVVAYTESVKTSLGGVPAQVLAREGAVSEAVAGALATGVRDRMGAEVGLAVLGVAGPALQAGRAVGTVCLGVALPEGPPRVRTVVLPSRSRTQIQEWATSVVLDHLRRALGAGAADPADPHDG
ncbi:MAG: competence/damage-inducible protein A [Egibacteraceae bacterium]